MLGHAFWTSFVDALLDPLWSKMCSKWRLHSFCFPFGFFGAPEAPFLAKEPTTMNIDLFVHFWTRFSNPCATPCPWKASPILLGGERRWYAAWRLPPQQGDSNLGWVGGHQWGLSWRDRPPAPAARRLCVISTQGHCVSPKSRISGEVFAEGSAP